MTTFLSINTIITAELLLSCQPRAYDITAHIFDLTHRIQAFLGVVLAINHFWDSDLCFRAGFGTILVVHLQPCFGTGNLEPQEGLFLVPFSIKQ